VNTTNDYHPSPQQMSLGRFDLDALIRACLGLRSRVLGAPACEPRLHLRETHVDFQDTMPAARARIADPLS
jgi:hypothetical protein